MSYPAAQALPQPDRVVIINDSATAQGGSAVLALLLVELLRARGVPVTFIAGDTGDNPRLAEIGVDIVALGEVPLLGRGKLEALRKGIDNPAAREMVARFVAETDTPGTIYHVHSWAQIFSPSIFSALAPVAARTVVHAHDMFLACPNGVYMDFHHGLHCTRRPLSADCITTHCDKRSYPQKLWRVARQAALFRQFGQALPWAGIAMIHPGMTEPLQRAGYPAERLVTVRNPASPYTDHRIPAEENAGALFVGRVEPDKGVEDLIEAARAVDMPVSVVGEGPLRERLAAQHPEVTFVGWQDRAGIARQAAHARVLVMPSRFPEPFGLVAAEALMSGLPVIVTELSFLVDELRAGDLGLTYPPRDTAALAACLRQIKNKPVAEMRALSERARAAEIALKPDGWADAVMALYGKTLAASAA
ncbi:glycosyltransferase family 4 protein [Rhodovulum iodosum]|nr:glycosyltransferase [Rhodovulum robiginosum]